VDSLDYEDHRLGLTARKGRISGVHRNDQRSPRAVRAFRKVSGTAEDGRPPANRVRAAEEEVTIALDARAELSDEAARDVRNV
jgi:hypothetical protein